MSELTLPICVVECQRTENDGTPASNNESDNCCCAITWVMARAINVHKRRD